jgi:integrase
MASIKYLKDRKRFRYRWHITCYDGFVDKGSKCFKFRADAEEFKRLTERRADRLRAGLSRPSETIPAAVAKFTAYSKRHTARTQGHYSAVIARFTASLPPQVTDVKQISTAHVSTYIDEKISELSGNGSTNPNRTANAHLTAIKSFCRWIASNYDIPNAAAPVSMLTELPPQQRFLTPKEYGKVLKAVKGFDRHVILFLANSGLRATEFCELTADNFSRDKKRLTIIGKGRKQQSVPLNKTCRDILSRLKPKGHIYLPKNGSHNPRHALYRLCKRTAKAADIPVFGPHSLRHWFATELLLRGVPVSHVSKLLGHASIRTTEKTYIHFLPYQLDGVTEVLVSS